MFHLEWTICVKCDLRRQHPQEQLQDSQVLKEMPYRYRTCIVAHFIFADMSAQELDRSKLCTMKYRNYRRGASLQELLASVVED